MDWSSQNHLKCQKGKLSFLFTFLLSFCLHFTKSKQIFFMFVYFFLHRSPLWTAVAYAAFDIATNPESKEAKNKAVSVYL